jgi:hypothetical protein
MVSAAKAMLIRSMKETRSRMNRNQIRRRKTLRNTRSSVTASANMLDWVVAAIGTSLARCAGRRVVDAPWAALPRSRKAVGPCNSSPWPHLSRIDVLARSE